MTKTNLKIAHEQALTSSRPTPGLPCGVAPMTRAELLRWPTIPDNNLVPWYVTGWCLLWAPLMYLGLALAWAGILLSGGYPCARRFWKRALS